MVGHVSGLWLRSCGALGESARALTRDQREGRGRVEDRAGNRGARRGVAQAAGRGPERTLVPTQCTRRGAGYAADASRARAGTRRACSPRPRHAR